ncbi:hypothetical protein CLF_104311 [Clonorchis sinensis]|uniref:Uncharacterized protein n=1 Tax=Clonorchis sinensis TaxID=79923 RepID=G7YBD6_CLOSI|nr:hypothetical protein CLF_104311 [Clonorchis sinensis]
MRGYTTFVRSVKRRRWCHQRSLPHAGLQQVYCGSCLHMLCGAQSLEGQGYQAFTRSVWWKYYTIHTAYNECESRKYRTISGVLSTRDFLKTSHHSSQMVSDELHSDATSKSSLEKRNGGYFGSDLFKMARSFFENGVFDYVMHYSSSEFKLGFRPVREVNQPRPKRREALYSCFFLVENHRNLLVQVDTARTSATDRQYACIDPYVNDSKLHRQRIDPTVTGRVRTRFAGHDAVNRYSTCEMFQRMGLQSQVINQVDSSKKKRQMWQLEACLSNAPFDGVNQDQSYCSCDTPSWKTTGIFCFGESVSPKKKSEMGKNPYLQNRLMEMNVRWKGRSSTIQLLWSQTVKAAMVIAIYIITCLSKSAGHFRSSN